MDIHCAAWKQACNWLIRTFYPGKKRAQCFTLITIADIRNEASLQERICAREDNRVRREITMFKNVIGKAYSTVAACVRP